MFSPSRFSRRHRLSLASLAITRTRIAQQFNLQACPHIAGKLPQFTDVVPKVDGLSFSHAISCADSRGLRCCAVHEQKSHNHNTTLLNRGAIRSERAPDMLKRCPMD
jgi:hypothetical protein